MQLLRVRDNGKHRDVTYRNRCPTWDLLDKNNIWESYEPLPLNWLVPQPKTAVYSTLHTKSYTCG